MNLLLIIGWLLIGFAWACLAIMGMQFETMFSLRGEPSRLNLVVWFVILLLAGPVGVVLSFLVGLVRYFVDIRWRR